MGYLLLPLFFFPFQGRSECELPEPVPTWVWAGPPVASIKAAPNKSICAGLTCSCGSNTALR